MGRASVRRGNGSAGKYSVSMYPVDLAVLAEVQERQYLNTLSAALQFVIRRYADEHGIEVRGRSTSERLGSVPAAPETAGSETAEQAERAADRETVRQLGVAL